MFELRAAISLACIWAERGDRRRAYQLLAPVYGWFTEGFDTADLKDGKALLDALAWAENVQPLGLIWRYEVNRSLASNFVERQCLSVSSLYLGQPRGIANLMFVSGPLSDWSAYKKQSGYRMDQVNGRGESWVSESDSEPPAVVQGAQLSAKNDRIPGLFRAD
jgi:hypothetical protein